MSSLSNDWETGKVRNAKKCGKSHPKVKTGEGKDAETKMFGVNLSKGMFPTHPKAGAGEGKDGETKIGGQKR